MTQMRHSARIPALPAALAAALIALAALCGAAALAPAAHAHDQLIATDPADGDTLAESPAELRLSFSGEIQDIGSAVELTDSSGAAHDVDTSVERSDLVVAPAEPLPAGDYSLAWRVTSSDGHPIEGTVDNDGAVEFTVEGGAGNDGAAAATSAPAGDEPTSAPASSAPDATQPVSPEASASQSSGPVELDLTEEESSWAAPLIILLLAAAALAAVVVVIAKVRNQQK